jgi:hypothetical protein
VAGWGRLSEKGVLPSILQHVSTIPTNANLIIKQFKLITFHVYEYRRLNPGNI